MQTVAEISLHSLGFFKNNQRTLIWESIECIKCIYHSSNIEGIIDYICTILYVSNCVNPCSDMLCVIECWMVLSNTDTDTTGFEDLWSDLKHRAFGCELSITQPVSTPLAKGACSRQGGIAGSPRGVLGEARAQRTRKLQFMHGLQLEMRRKKRDHGSTGTTRKRKETPNVTVFIILRYSWCCGWSFKSQESCKWSVLLAKHDTLLDPNSRWLNDVADNLSSETWRIGAGLCSGLFSEAYG